MFYRLLYCRRFFLYPIYFSSFCVVFQVCANNFSYFPLFSTFLALYLCFISPFSFLPAPLYLPYFVSLLPFAPFSYFHGSLLFCRDPFTPPQFLNISSSPPFWAGVCRDDLLLTGLAAGSPLLGTHFSACGIPTPGYSLQCLRDPHSWVLTSQCLWDPHSWVLTSVLAGSPLLGTHFSSCGIPTPGYRTHFSACGIPTPGYSLQCLRDPYSWVLTSVLGGSPLLGTHFSACRISTPGYSLQCLRDPHSLVLSSVHAGSPLLVTHFSACAILTPWYYSLGIPFLGYSLQCNRSSFLVLKSALTGSSLLLGFTSFLSVGSPLIGTHSEEKL